MTDLARLQLAAVTETAESFEAAGIDYWLFGGWAVDLYAGAVTRPHDDVDLAVWLDDRRRIAELLAQAGWAHAPEAGEDGGTGYERGPVRIELTFLVREDDGRVYTPLRGGPGRWEEGAFGDDVVEALGARSRVISLAALVQGKSSGRDDPEDAKKDRGDLVALRAISDGRSE